jgi:hypothetical protein
MPPERYAGSSRKLRLSRCFHNFEQAQAFEYVPIVPASARGTRLAAIIELSRQIIDEMNRILGDFRESLYKERAPVGIKSTI